MLRILLMALLGAFLLIFLAIGLGAFYFVSSHGLAPRMLAQLGRAAEPQAIKIDPEVGRLLTRLVQALDDVDRAGMAHMTPEWPMLPSAQALPLSANHRLVAVASPAAAIAAIQNAQPGDVITFAPGTYRFTGRAISVERAGSEKARIIIRAAQPGTVQLEFDMLEGFHVLAPYWTFENLSIRGVCAAHGDCEHAFHVVGRAQYFVALNNTISDFNAHFKINGENGQMPDHGLIEGNMLSNRDVRHTDNPVTPIDLVAASDWQVVGNRISDFIKEGGDQVSYAAYFKGGGDHNSFERNVVICEQKLRSLPGSRVGLSLGGGGSAAAFCRDQQCKVEQDRSVIQSNLIMACSDVGIYINRASNSRLVHNTLLDTAGIDVRFPESSVEVEGNLVDGVIRSRNGGMLKEIDNYPVSLPRLYVGSHPVRDLFKNVNALDLAWNGAPPRRNSATSIPPDLCMVTRSAQPVYGAFEDYRKCQIKAGQ